MRDNTGWQQRLVDDQTKGTVVLCAKCATRFEDYGLCKTCSRAVWEATDLGRLYRRYFDDPELNAEVTTYAHVAMDGTLTTISWYLQRRTDCNGDPSGWWIPTIRVQNDRPGSYVNRSRSDGSLCADPFYSTDSLVKELAR